MATPIDYLKSIHNGRLISRISFGTVMTNISDYLCWLTGIVSFSWITIATWRLDLIHLVSTIVLLWLLMSLFYMKALIKLPYEFRVPDNKSLVSFLEDRFPGFQVRDHVQTVVLDRSFWYPSWSRRITIVIGENGLYINTMTLGRWDIPSAFHVVVNRRRSRKLADELSYTFLDLPENDNRNKTSFKS